MGVESVAEIYRSQIAEYNSKAAERKSGWEKIGNTVKAAGEDALSFQECMKNAAVRQTEGNETAVKETTAKETGTKEIRKKEITVFPEGKDVIMAHPPTCRTNYGVDMNKSKDEMTLDEYKQYICNKVSGLPVSDSMRTCSSGVLIFKEEAFESMKNDPSYENEVIQMLREGFSAEIPGYAANVGYQVIGKSRGECYGAGIPVKNYGWMAGLQNGLSLSGLSTGIWPYGISGLGLSSSGLLTSGLLPSGYLGAGLLALGEQTGSTGGRTGSTGGIRTGTANRANMVNAYKNTARNRDSYLNGKTLETRWV